jgi:hypothetical protein
MGDKDYVFPDGRILGTDGKIIEPEGWSRAIDPKVVEFINRVPKDPPPARSLDEGDIERPLARTYKRPPPGRNAAITIRSPRNRAEINPRLRPTLPGPSRDQQILPVYYQRITDMDFQSSHNNLAALHPQSPLYPNHHLRAAKPVNLHPNPYHYQAPQHALRDLSQSQHRLLRDSLVSRAQPTHNISNRGRGTPRISPVGNSPNNPSRMPSQTRPHTHGKQLEDVSAVALTGNETTQNQCVYIPKPICL